MWTTLVLMMNGAAGIVGDDQLDPHLSFLREAGRGVMTNTLVEYIYFNRQNSAGGNRGQGLDGDVASGLQQSFAPLHLTDRIHHAAGPRDDLPVAPDVGHQQGNAHRHLLQQGVGETLVTAAGQAADVQRLDVGPHISGQSGKADDLRQPMCFAESAAGFKHGAGADGQDLQTWDLTRSATNRFEEDVVVLLGTKDRDHADYEVLGLQPQRLTCLDRGGHVSRLRSITLEIHAVVNC